MTDQSGLISIMWALYGIARKDTSSGEIFLDQKTMERAISLISHPLADLARPSLSFIGNL
jgi:hypothetical protein